MIAVSSRLSRVFVMIALGFFVAWTLLPLIWAVITSLLPNAAVTQSPPDLNPAGFTLRNYIDAMAAGPDLPGSMRNSLIVSLITGSLSILLGAPAAYALAKLGVPGSQKMLLMILGSQMFPAIIVAIPMFVIFSNLGLTNTYTALIVVNISFILPIVIWVLKGFFDSVPDQLEKSAAIDGAGVFRTFAQIVLPISAPPVFAVAVFAFIESWNEFFFAVILTGFETKTVPIAISEFSGQYQTLYGQMIASSIVASIPVVALAIIFRKYIVKGFIEGSVKG
ncbi:carbohydrate ABC transporter permease [Leucobacter sp. GX24907]